MSLTSNADIDKTNMNVTDGPQGQGFQPNASKKNMTDNGMSPHRESDPFNSAIEIEVHPGNVVMSHIKSVKNQELVLEDNNQSSNPFLPLENARDLTGYSLSSTRNEKTIASLDGTNLTGNNHELPLKDNSQGSNPFLPLENTWHLTRNSLSPTRNEKTDSSLDKTNLPELCPQPNTSSTNMQIDDIQKDVNKLNICEDEPKREEKESMNRSEVVVNKHSESLVNIMGYVGSSESEESDEETNMPADYNKSASLVKSNTEKAETSWESHIEQNDSADSDSDSSTSTLSSETETEGEHSDRAFDNSDGDSSSVIDASDDAARVESPVLNESNDKGAVKKTGKNRLNITDYFPPIPDLSMLNISADTEFMSIGKISAIIVELVTIDALPGTPAFDLDSMLFINDKTDKKPLGPIYDVLGPVSEPIYCVRFNSKEELDRVGVKVGMDVFAAHKSDEFSKYVFVRELLNMKGSDASWLRDEELPLEMNEFSDDEQEREARRAKRAEKMPGKRKLNDDSLERHQKYEKAMNQCNSLNTKVCQLVDARRGLSRRIRSNPREETEVQQPSASYVPEFNPAIPPPGFSMASPYPMHTSNYVPQLANSFNMSALNPLTDPNVAQTSYSPLQFGSFYANQPPAPQTVGPPPARWQQFEAARWLRQNQRNGHHRQNPESHFPNEYNYKGPGPSSQQF